MVAGSLRNPGAARWWVMWPWDARAGGLVSFGETGALPNREFTKNDSVVEVAPALKDVKVIANRRVYLVRPLPGQTLKTYEDACLPLAWRWKAVSVKAVPHPTLRGFVVLDVITGESLDTPLTYPGGP